MEATRLADHCGCFTCPECVTEKNHRPLTCNACRGELAVALGMDTAQGVTCAVPHPDDDTILCVRTYHDRPNAGCHVAVVAGESVVWEPDQLDDWVHLNARLEDRSQHAGQLEEYPTCKVVIGRACGRGAGNSIVFTCDQPRPCERAHEQVMAEAFARRDRASA